MVSSVRRGLLIPKCFESDDRGRDSPDGELACLLADAHGRPATRRVKSGKAPRHRWHLRQPWQFRICKLQILQGLTGFESHPLRQSSLRSVLSARVVFRLRATRVPLVALGTNPKSAEFAKTIGSG